MKPCSVRKRDNCQTSNLLYSYKNCSGYQLCDHEGHGSGIVTSQFLDQLAFLQPTVCIWSRDMRYQDMLEFWLWDPWQPTGDSRNCAHYM